MLQVHPADLGRALDADPAARAAYDRLPYSCEREQVRAIESAKRPEARARRIEKAVAALRETTVAELPLVIEACEYDCLHAVLAYDFERITTHVRLVGAGSDGLGEDVSVFAEDGSSLHEWQPSLREAAYDVGAAAAELRASGFPDAESGRWKNGDRDLP